MEVASELPLLTAAHFILVYSSQKNNWSSVDAIG